MPIGYKTDLVLLSQISRTQQKKRHVKLMLQAPRNDPTTSPPQRLPCNKLSLAWLSFSINLLRMTVPWPQIGLVYIGMELVSHPQLPPRIWPPKMPNIPQKWRKSAKNRLLINKKPNFVRKTHLWIVLGIRPPNTGRVPLYMVT
jgi:hypothetical protein